MLEVWYFVDMMSTGKMVVVVLWHEVRLSYVAPLVFQLILDIA